MKIKSIVRLPSESGHPDCVGHCDIPVHITFDGGLEITTNTCQCGNGCHKSFPANYFKVGDNFPTGLDFWKVVEEARKCNFAL